VSDDDESEDDALFSGVSWNVERKKSQITLTLEPK